MVSKRFLRVGMRAGYKNEAERSTVTPQSLLSLPWTDYVVVCTVQQTVRQVTTDPNTRHRGTTVLEISGRCNETGGRIDGWYIHHRAVTLQTNDATATCITNCVQRACQYHIGSEEGATLINVR